MKVKRISFIFIFTVFLPFIIFPANGNKDPFTPLLPEEESKRRPVESVEPEKEVSTVTPEEITTLTVEGVLWGTEKPLAIIDGDVFSEGDSLINVEAKVQEIKKSKVILLYKGRVFKKKITPKKEGK